ncbi:hypothetical protein PbB2_02407 [Candidatus Phycosocius bacilliformis]|uniref:Uncharacterized protein n=1 Tax=Candidatus Phycosocius bacilliformis TaxID=1445552 RepID=A0A2P2ECD5_9PROT|nr:hypothetical protein PbB2_02407 [Candidatus Phycosocius bacilliformis]
MAWVNRNGDSLAAINSSPTILRGSAEGLLGVNSKNLRRLTPPPGVQIRLKDAPTVVEAHDIGSVLWSMGFSD